jgi:hypothetical protein
MMVWWAQECFKRDKETIVVAASGVSFDLVPVNVEKSNPTIVCS